MKYHDKKAAYSDEYDEYRNYILQVYERAIDELLNDEQLNEKTKTEAHRLIKQYYGFDVENSNPLYTYMVGFLMGIYEGMDIGEVFAAAEQNRI